MIGIAFGGLSGDNHTPYISFTTVGLICILTSVITNSRKVFFWTRLIGLLFVPALTYFDIKHSYTFEKSWENIKDILTYMPAVVFAIYTLYSIIKLLIVARQKSG